MRIGIPRLTLVACAAAIALLGVAPHRSAPDDATSAAAVQSRSYAMGWAATPPVLTTDSILATAQSMSAVSDYALVQRQVPWPQLLGGTTITAELDNEQPFIDYLRSLGLKIVWLVDPLDGLDRRREPPDLVAAGRSLLEPQIRAMHEAWVRASVQRFHPEYVGLASEINTLAAHGDAALYSTIVDMVNTLTPDVHALDPGARVFVSFQMEDAWQHAPFPPSSVDQFQLIDDFNIDALGLSSYPSFGFAHPADVPADYYQRFAQATSLPLLQVEGGWSSVASPWGGGSLADQAQYIQRTAAFLDAVQSPLWVSLFYADLNLADPSWNLPPDRQAELQNFASQGIVTSDFSHKPAYDQWKLVFDRPLVPPVSGPDTDGDAVPDAVDNCPSAANPTQINTDNQIENGTGIAAADTTLPNAVPDADGDACETDGDTDNDGLPDAEDTEPLGATGICAAFVGQTDAHPNPAGGDVTNTDGNGPSWDTDNDGVLDGVECQLGTNPRSASSKPTASRCGGDADVDFDGLPISAERCKWGTSDLSADTDGDGKKDGVEANDTNGDGVANFPSDTINSAKAANNIIQKTMDFDLNGDGVVNFPGDTILSAKMVNNVAALGALEHPPILDTLGIPQLNAGMLTPAFHAGFENVDEFAGFYITPQSPLTRHELQYTGAHEGAGVHVAWLTGASGVEPVDGPNHRGYPTVQLYETSAGACVSPCLIQFWARLEDIQMDPGEWFSLATLSPDASNQWSRVIGVNVGWQGWLHLFHVPDPGVGEWDYQRTDLPFPLGSWVRITIWLDLDPDHGSAAAWQNGTLMSAARVNGGDGTLDQMHFGLYAAASLTSAKVWNDDLSVWHVTAP